MNNIEMYVWIHKIHTLKVYFVGLTSGTLISPTLNNKLQSICSLLSELKKADILKWNTTTWYQSVI